MTAHAVFRKWKFLNSMNSGSAVAKWGIIAKPRMRKKRILRPTKRYLLNANPAMAANKVPTIEPTLE